MGDEKALAIPSHEDMTAIISRRGRDEPGEKRRNQLGSCDYPLEDGVVSIRLSTVRIIVVITIIRLLHDEGRLRFWFDQLPDLEANWPVVSFIFAGPVGSGRRSLSCVL